MLRKLSLFKRLFISVILVLVNNINYTAERNLYEKDLLKIPVYDTEGGKHSAYEIINGDIVFPDKDAAEKAGFTFSNDNKLTLNSTIAIISRSSGGYSYGIIRQGQKGYSYAIDLGLVEKQFEWPKAVGVHKGPIIIKPDDEKTKINKALFNAVAFNEVKIVGELLAQGADPDYIFDKQKKITPFMVAAIEGNIEIIDKLLAKGANLESKNYINQTPLIYAIMANQQDAALHLLKKGSKFDVLDMYGNTPLHWAAFHGLNDVVKTIIESKVDIDIRNNFGANPLLYTLEKNFPETALILLNFGADPCLKNKKGEFFRLKIKDNLKMLEIWHEYENSKIIKFINALLEQKKINAESIKNIVDKISTIESLSKMPKEFWEALFATYELPKDYIEGILNSINQEIKRINCES